MRPILIGVGTAFVVVTAPISVPYIMIMFREDNKGEDDDRHVKRIIDPEAILSMK